MKKISTAVHKKLLGEILLFSNTDLDIQGKRVYRKDIPNDKFEVYSKVLKKIKDNMEFGFLPKNSDGTPIDLSKVEDKDINWLPLSNKIKDPLYIPLFERHIDKELELLDEEIDVVKYFYQRRKDIHELKEVKEFGDWLYDRVEEKTN